MLPIALATPPIGQTRKTQQSSKGLHIQRHPIPLKDPSPPHNIHKRLKTEHKTTYKHQNTNPKDKKNNPLKSYHNIISDVV
jgi:hypothetical protein